MPETKRVKPIFINNRRGGCEGHFFFNMFPRMRRHVSLQNNSYATPVLTTPAQCRKLAAWLNATADVWEKK